MATQNYFKAKNGLEIPSLDTVAATSNSFPTIRPTLNLDFANSKTVDERITFTRSTKASYYDAKGVLQYANADEPRIDHDPVTGECKGLLIEEQRTNLLIASNNFNASHWNLQNTSSILTNCAIAPDGTMTAALVKSNGTYGIFQSSIAVSGSSQNTKSVWLKGVLGGETVQLKDPWLTVGYTLCALTTSWQRFILSETQSGGLAGLWVSNIPSTGVYIWGPQLEQGSFATSYIPSTTTFTSRASSATYFDSTGTLRTAGVNQPRYGYAYDSSSAKWISQGVILENAATNLMSWQGLTPNPGTYLTPNAGMAIDGTQSATLLNGAVAPYNWYQSIAVTNGAAYTVSIYAKAGSSTNLTFGVESGLGNIGFAYFTLSGSGTASAATSAAFASITPVGNGWYRCVVTGIAASTSFTLHCGSANAYVCGLQLEAGYTPTSVIWAAGATATRAADVSSSSATTRASEYGYAQIGDWFNQTQGSIYSEFDIQCGNADNKYSAIVSIDNPISVTQTLGISKARSGIANGKLYGTAYSASNIGSTLYADGVYKAVASGVVGGNTVFTLNGTTTTMLAYAAMTYQPTRITIGNDCYGSQMQKGYIKKITYYAKALSNVELQALTK